MRIASEESDYWKLRSCCENRHRTTLRGRAQAHGHRSPTQSPPPSAFSFRLIYPYSSTKVGSGIRRVRPASGFLLVAQSKSTLRGGFSYNSASFRRVAPDWALTTSGDLWPLVAVQTCFERPRPSLPTTRRPALRPDAPVDIAHEFGDNSCGISTGAKRRADQARYSPGHP